GGERRQDRRARGDGREVTQHRGQADERADPELQRLHVGADHGRPPRAGRTSGIPTFRTKPRPPAIASSEPRPITFIAISAGALAQPNPYVLRGAPWPPAQCMPAMIPMSPIP